MITDDRYIEVLTAALQKATISEADVQWNVKIGNRQFDVLAKIQAGMHSMLMAFEVKNKSRRVPVEAMDAFVTKTRDAGINKGVFVSTSGFQSGAIDVAKKHGIDLFLLEILPSDLPGIEKRSAHIIVSRAGAQPFNGLEVNVIKHEQHMNVIERLDLVYADGRTLTLPDEPSQMAYYVERTTLSGGRSLGDAINQAASQPVALDTSVTRRVHIRGRIIPPDTFFVHKGNVKEAVLHMKGVLGKVISSNARFELTSSTPFVRYKDLSTGKAIEVPAHTLPVGEGQFTPGNFFFSYDPLRYFYCESVEGTTAEIYLVESFQSGELVQAVFTQDAAYGRYYFDLSDKKIISRLEARLAKMKQKPSPESAAKPNVFTRFLNRN
jgi:hypothetical protein